MSSQEKLRNIYGAQIYELVPCNIAIIDRDYNIIHNNRNFTEVFGHGIGKKCYHVYKNLNQKCSRCMAEKTFNDGKIRVNDEEGVDKNGRKAHYIVHIAPIYDPNGEIPYIIEMSTDVTETKRLQREYHILFERVPCFIAILNNEYRIVRANERFRQVFGDTTGEHCYRVLKRRESRCENCPAEETFNDGKIHTAYHIGASKKGKETHYLVTTSALSKGEGKATHIIEMALDMTELHKLERELAEANTLMETLIRNSMDGIIATNEKGVITIFNPAAEDILGFSAAEMLNQKLPMNYLPEKMRESIEKGEDSIYLPETLLRTKMGQLIPVRFSGMVLKSGDRHIGMAAHIQDLREIKKLEKEKIDAERFSAVGQTVAAMAHSIKNLLTGLEGGMYMVNSGLKKGKQDRIEQGWDMLQRNIDKVSKLSRNLLGFSKGRKPDVKMVSPSEIAEEAVRLFADSIKKQGINLSSRLQKDIPAAPLDKDAILECLSNLITNAIDACQMSEKKEDCSISIECMEREGCIIYKVSDTGCGIDYDVKNKVFTDFFTTKGSQGTGLGLLITRKIINEHGGNIDFESAPAQGTSFIIKLPRERLPEPNEKDAQ